MHDKSLNNSFTNLIEVKNLKKHFPVYSGILRRATAWVQAVDGVSFGIHEGETLGLVGESGCGKTTVARAIIRLISATAGSVNYDGVNIFELDGKAMKEMRRNIQIVFQDPYASLNPRVPIGESIAEGLKNHRIGRTQRERHDTAVSALERVGLQAYHATRYPHEFSGGQRQRIGIARALVLKPKCIILDEPVSALDVSIQAEVLNILKDLQEEFGLTYLFVAHNLAVVEHISTRVAVMYLGKIVEIADRESLFTQPSHPYTQALMSAIPNPDPDMKRKRLVLKGDVPSSLNPPAGCHFHPRCQYAIDQCSQKIPRLDEIRPGHRVACHLAGEV
ncbi:MAG: dipeptide ABC transporter ATP-binding protein [Chloroflexi bacterium]|nr:dipeptide ABC transporter ATP-binding protein [Chloroflexota bacterium]